MAAEAAWGSLSFEEQIAFLRDKLDIPTERWTDLARSGHDAGFMVAGAAKADLLADLHAAVVRMAAEGTTLDEFRDQFEDIVARHGWTGWTGEGSAAGRAWRVRTIYDTNLFTSYAAGRYAQAQQVWADRPYWRYQHMDGVLHPRPLHVSWDGLVLPAGHAWWSTHWPPNDWGCHCYVETLSADDLAALGKDGPDPAPQDGTYAWTDPATGQTRQIPDGVGPNWDYAPGASLDPLRLRILDKADRLPAPLGVDLRAAVVGAAGTTDLLSAALAKVEAEIGGQPKEVMVALDGQGREVLRILGSEDRIPSDPANQGLLQGNTVTHGHPVITAFSMNDLKFAVAAQLRELRAVDALYTYSIMPPPEGWAKQGAEILTTAEAIEAAVWGEMTTELMAGRIDESTFNRELYHRIWTRLAAQGAISYTRTPR